nr:hypothetical protein [Akkermansiaceae bacterium]
MDSDDDGKVTLDEFTARLRHHRNPDGDDGADDGEDDGADDDAGDRPEFPNWGDLFDQLRERL